jgi:hypothetical protein
MLGCSCMEEASDRVTVYKEEGAPCLSSLLSFNNDIIVPLIPSTFMYRASLTPGGDVTILNYALTLGYLERKFYQEGLANYTQADFVAAGFPDPLCANLCEIYYDEKVSCP